MTQPNDLPPLPEGMRGYDHENGEWHMICFESQLRDYGLQCAEAAVERERARCLKEKDEVARCTNSDSWNCKYCSKTATCKALQDDRNFNAPREDL